ncbi:MAG: hypothetical protein Solumvirus3_25 [Solumvirus sp.]|uniref:Uncharacterized protein n=1 Tax=Solumvirus sp. TaxID=2487773 RepID=A0A3G5AKD1_9VIRU|nr:MAG: hypothetical protein Solumvirus3_25 [Solumvirus sp.]
MPPRYKKKPKDIGLFKIYRTGPPNKDTEAKALIPSECKEGKYYQMASIDPAHKNFGLRVERRWFDGRITTEFFDVFNLTPVAWESVYSVACVVLDKILNLLKECHIIVFELQLWDNYKMTRMGQHILTHLIIRLTQFPKTEVTPKINIFGVSPPKTITPIIIEIQSSVKTRQLGGACGLNKRGIKEWAVKRALEILTERKDQKALDILNAKKKKDDLADTVVQLEALCQLSHDELPWKGPIKFVSEKNGSSIPQTNSDSKESTKIKIVTSNASTIIKDGVKNVSFTGDVLSVAPKFKINIAK